MANILYLINGITLLVVSVLGFFGYSIFRKRKRCEYGILGGIFGIIYLGFSAINFFWFFGLLLSKEYLVNNTIFLVMLSAILAIVSYRVSRNVNLLLMRIVSFCALFIIFYFTGNIYWIYLISVFIIFVSFLEIDSVQFHRIKNFGISGMAYCFVHLAILAAYWLGIRIPILFIPEMIMAFAFYSLVLHAKTCDKRIRLRESRLHFPVVSAVLHLVKFVLFIIPFGLFVMFGTLAVHEMGHVITAKFYRCSYSAVIYQSGNSAETNVGCFGFNHNKEVMLIAGFMITSLLAVVLFVSGNEFVKSLSYMIFGIGIIVANRDFAELALTNGVIILLNVFGIVFILISLVRIALHYIKEKDVLDD